MRIAISINGQGRGHLTRMTALGQLLAHEHELTFWCPEKYHSFLKTNFPQTFIYPIPYYQFVLDGPKIDVIKTGLVNVEHIISQPIYTSDLVDQLRLMDADLLISDFEPFLPKAARKAGIPIIQLNHPSIVLRSMAFTPDALLARLISASMMGEYDIRIISSFYNGDVGPIIREEIKEARPCAGDYFLVYLYPSIQDKVIDIIEKHPEIKYKTFPDPNENFVEAIAQCRGIITNSGHQLLSEALHLEKPILSLPMEGQFEQKLNADMLNKSGRGIIGSTESISDDLNRFLRFADKYNPVCPSTKDNIQFCLKDDSDKALSLLNYHLHKYKSVS